MSERFRPRVFHAHALAAAALAMLATAALAAGPAPRAKARPAHAVKPVPAVAASAQVPAPGELGLMAFLDPETGLLTGPISSLVPPADQRAAAANVVLEPVQLPGGAWMLDLKGTGMESYVLHIDPLGARTVTCVQDARVPAVLATPTPAPPARKER